MLFRSGMPSQFGVSKSPPLHTNLVELTEHLDLAPTVVERRYVSVFSIHGSFTPSACRRNPRQPFSRTLELNKGSVSQEDKDTEEPITLPRVPRRQEPEAANSKLPAEALDGPQGYDR